MRNFLFTVNCLYLVEGFDTGRKTSVHAKGLLVDEGRQREIVENFGAVPPHIHTAVLAEAFVVEAIDLGDLARLVVAADKRNAVRIAHFERQQQKEGLHAVKAAVHEVAHKEIIGAGTVATHLEKLDQVKELAVDVTADRNGRVNVVNVRLFDKDVFGCVAEVPHFGLLDEFALLKLRDLSVEVAVCCHITLKMIKTGSRQVLQL